MSRPVKAQDPSIEDILASIRRSIISDDDPGEPAPAEVAPARTPSRVKADAKKAIAKKALAKNGQDDADALGGFDASADQDPDNPPHARLAADVIELGEAIRANAPADITVAREDDSLAPARQRAPRGPGSTAAPAGPLLPPRATAVVDDTAFNSLAHMVLTQNPRTLEDLVRDMLKPMLKAWLDDNLPDLIERLVRAEIERVSRGEGRAQ